MHGDVGSKVTDIYPLEICVDFPGRSLSAKKKKSMRHGHKHNFLQHRNNETSLAQTNGLSNICDPWFSDFSTANPLNDSTEVCEQSWRLRRERFYLVNQPLNAITGKGTRKLRTGHAQQTTKVFGIIFSTYYNTKSEQKFPSFVKQCSVTCIGPSQMANKMHNRSKSQLVVLTNVGKKTESLIVVIVKTLSERSHPEWQFVVHNKNIGKIGPRWHCIVKNEGTEFSSQTPICSSSSKTSRKFQVGPQSSVWRPAHGKIFKFGPKTQFVFQNLAEFSTQALGHNSSSENERIIVNWPHVTVRHPQIDDFLKLAPSHSSSSKNWRLFENWPQVATRRLKNAILENVLPQAHPWGESGFSSC